MLCRRVFTARNSPALVSSKPRVGNHSALGFSEFTPSLAPPYSYLHLQPTAEEQVAFHGLTYVRVVGHRSSRSCCVYYLLPPGKNVFHLLVRILGLAFSTQPLCFSNKYLPYAASDAVRV